MEFNLLTNIESCHIEIPSLLYYSHIPTAVVALFLGFFVFLKSRNLASKILMFLTLVFSLWALFNLIVWTNFNGQLIMFFWSSFGILDPMIFFLFFYFIYVFICKKDLDLRWKLLLTAIILPAILFNLKNTGGIFNISNCEAGKGGIYDYYIFGLEIFFTLLTVVFSIFEYYKTKANDKKQIIIASAGVLLFFLCFFTTGFVASYLDNKGISYAFEIEQYGLFGMTFFIGILAFMIVKFKAFNIKMIGAQALVYSLIILIGSQFFFIRSNTNRILTGITLALAIGFGIFLIESVKKEVKRKEELQNLMEKLAQANDKLRELDNAKSEFISIASHQLRTPLTSIKGYISLIVEGTYGKIDQCIVDPLNKIYISNERLIQLVEDLLNVSRIESGRMEYEYGKHKIEDTIRELYDTFSVIAKGKGLYLHLELPENHLPEIEIDGSKTREVISNLIDNAMKYTKRGGVTVRAELVSATNNLQMATYNGDAVRVTVIDTGMGVPDSELPYLFSKFSRGKDTSRLHVSGTGLGLFVGKSMIEAQHGRIWVESKGSGMGSKFIVELPIEQPKNV